MKPDLEMDKNKKGCTKDVNDLDKDYMLIDNEDM